MPMPDSPLTGRGLLSAGLGLPLAAATRRPNIVFILVDDMRWDEQGSSTRGVLSRFCHGAWDEANRPTA
jgi:hypothetical protein